MSGSPRPVPGPWPGRRRSARWRSRSTSRSVFTSSWPMAAGSADDNHQALADAAEAGGVIQADALGGAAHDAADQLRQQYADQQDGGGAGLPWAGTARADRGWRRPGPAPQQLGGSQQEDQQHEPVDDLADQGRNWALDARAGTASCSGRYPPSAIQADLASSLDSRVSSSLAAREASSTTTSEPNRRRDEACDQRPLPDSWRSRLVGIEFHIQSALSAERLTGCRPVAEPLLRAIIRRFQATTEQHEQIADADLAIGGLEDAAEGRIVVVLRGRRLQQVAQRFFKGIVHAYLARICCLSVTPWEQVTSEPAPATGKATIAGHRHWPGSRRSRRKPYSLSAGMPPTLMPSRPVRAHQQNTVVTPSRYIAVHLLVHPQVLGLRRQPYPLAPSPALPGSG